MISKCVNYIPAINKVLFFQNMKVTSLFDAFMVPWQIGI